jgi:hypothetical protein
MYPPITPAWKVHSFMPPALPNTRVGSPEKATSETTTLSPLTLSSRERELSAQRSPEFLSLLNRSISWPLALEVLSSLILTIPAVELWRKWMGIPLTPTCMVFLSSAFSKERPSSATPIPPPWSAMPRRTSP